MSLDSSTNGLVNPNLSLGAGGNGQRYPNQFFDLAQQYMPPTIKELFRWCTFYYYNSPLIGSAIKKVSRYPITDLIFEDDKDSICSMWEKILVKDLKIKDRLMEVNLDYHVYGNAFVSVHLPFTRFLRCGNCANSQPIQQWDWKFQGESFSFVGKCKSCEHHGKLEVRDRPYKDRKGIRLIRWNPENIHLKYNEYTGRYIYNYSVPFKLKNAIFRGDKDVLEDTPMIVIEALRKKRMIRLNPNAIKHLKNPTLAEQDQGWGKPTIIHVLKDMFYLYTLRRAQEAIALEHIVPFDIIYPMPNAQQDPYIHTDLANWRTQIEGVIQKHRRDPNFKAVIPIPVGFGRLGGDGKALLLSPEMNYLTQTIVGGMGLPQEFLFGGLSWTGSSISLRTLENDFIQNRSQLLDLVEWIKDKIRIWMSMPDIKSMRFADFRMADDIQRNQQLVGLNAQRKVSDHTLLTELGYDYEEEVKKMLEEAHIQNYLMGIQTKGAAKSQGEGQLINFNYQQRLQEMAEKAQLDSQRRIREMQRGASVPSNVTESYSPEDLRNMRQGAEAHPSGGMPPGGEGEQMALPPGEEQAAVAPDGQIQAGDDVGAEVDQQLESRVRRWAGQLAQADESTARSAIAQIKMKTPGMGAQIEQAYNQIMAQQLQNPQMEEQEGADQDAATKSQGVLDNAMAPLPEQKAPTRSGMY